MALISSEPNSSRDLIALIRENFSFLELDAQCRVEVEDEPLITTVAYICSVATIEVSVDWRDQVVAVLVGRVVDGRRPPGYYVHEGRRMRVLLEDALEYGGIADRRAATELRQAMQTAHSRPLAEKIALYVPVLRGAIGRLPHMVHSIFD